MVHFKKCFNCSMERISLIVIRFVYKQEIQIMPGIANRRFPVVYTIKEAATTTLKVERNTSKEGNTLKIISHVRNIVYIFLFTS